MTTILATPETQARLTPLDAFERICLEVIQLEAIATAASTAMDECAPPASERRAFDRAHALIGTAAERSTTAVALCEELKALVEHYMAGKR